MSPTAHTGFPARPAWAGLLIALAIALIVGARFALRHGLAWPCLFLNLTGLPCLFCGSTRALAALAQWDLLGALRLNPLVLLGGAILLASPYFWGRLQRMPPAGWAAAAFLAGLNWLYLCLFLPR